MNAFTVMTLSTFTHSAIWTTLFFTGPSPHLDRSVTILSKVLNMGSRKSLIRAGDRAQILGTVVVRGVGYFDVFTKPSLAEEILNEEFGIGQGSGKRPRPVKMPEDKT